MTVTRRTALSGLTTMAFARKKEPEIGFQLSDDGIHILLRGHDMARYLPGDANTSRPFFDRIRSRAGVPLTRNHPPIPGLDPDDHGSFHPGIWLAFGDLGGVDFWRLKGRVRDEEPPRCHSGKRGIMKVTRRWEAPDGRLVCRETCRHQIGELPDGVVLTWESSFASETPFWFGDQEEMGLGIRPATPLIVRKGGFLLNSEGKRQEKEIWGQAAAWCDAYGIVDGKRLGLLMVPHPKNFRPSWWHARDYGLLVANPFGRAAFKQGEPSRVEVPAGQSFTYRVAILLHNNDHTQDWHPAEAADRVLKWWGKE